MTEKDRKDFALIASGVVIAFVLWLIWERRKSTPNISETNVVQQGESGTPPYIDGAVPPWAYWGSGNGPFAQGGVTPESVALFSLYKIPLPKFAYNGNSEIYMPLYGFVGYSAVGTY